ncbi:MAG TPA: glycosyltransferase family 2 protein [Chitinophagaceae bacterium]|nr:glycosyltransferase family 2 protein [Chitinophagaceae bacterium]
MTAIFWVSLALLFYCYLGYGILLAVLTLLSKPFRRSQSQVMAPVPVTLLISAYNESQVLPAKIQNSRELEYPEGLLHILVVTDGSDDGSADLVRSAGIRVLHQPVRKGKYAAIRRAMQEVDTPLVILTDANSMLNREAVYRIVRHYSDSRVGAVAGEKKIVSDNNWSAVGVAEGFYWKYESLMKRLDAQFFSVVGASGELFSIRTALFHSRRKEVILDDFIISMDVCLDGYRVAYEPGSYATELPSLTLEEEEKRKVRIAAGAFEATGLLGRALNPFRYPVLSFQFFSRRVMRWLVCPLLLPVLFASNLALAIRSGSPVIFDLLFGAQLVFYALAITGWQLVRLNRRAGLLTIPFYFLFMNYCLLRGFTRYFRGKQSPAWEKSLRADKVKG